MEQTVEVMRHLLHSGRRLRRAQRCLRLRRADQPQSRFPVTPAVKAKALATHAPQQLYGIQASSEELGPALRSVRAPVLFMQGDPRPGSAMSPAGMAHLRAYRPDAYLMAVPGAGHTIHHSHPALFVNALDRYVGANPP